MSADYKSLNSEPDHFDMQKSVRTDDDIFPNSNMAELLEPLNLTTSEFSEEVKGVKKPRPDE